MAGQVRLETQGAIALVTLSHPGKLNAMSRAMWGELRAVFEREGVTAFLEKRKPAFKP